MQIFNATCSNFKFLKNSIFKKKKKTLFLCFDKDRTYTIYIYILTFEVNQSVSVDLSSSWFPTYAVPFRDVTIWCPVYCWCSNIRNISYYDFQKIYNILYIERVLSFFSLEPQNFMNFLFWLIPFFIYFLLPWCTNPWSKW